MSQDAKKPVPNPKSLDRREFLQASAALGLGGMAFLPGCTEAEEEWVPGSIPINPNAAQEIQKRSTLGRTGIEIPDICFGSWGLEGKEDLVRHALDKGVTHFDTAPDYGDGGSELSIGRALAGDRQRVTIATKFWAPEDATRQDIMDSLDGSLKRLNTDYVDIFFNHAVNHVERIRNPEFLEFITLAKQQGKIRASGMSGHSGSLAECVDAAIDDDILDVFLMAHNYANEPDFWGYAQRFKDYFTGGFDFVAFQSEMPRLIQRAHEANLGVMAMKTRRGAKYNNLTRYTEEGWTEGQAALRWTLSNPNVDGLVITMWNHEVTDDYIGASGTGPPTLAETELLLQYEARNAGSLCQQGCSSCATACPAGVDIAGTLRTRMYAENYGRPEIAKTEYRGLGSPASPCTTCTSPVCVSSCPAGIDIPTLAKATHEALG